MEIDRARLQKVREALSDDDIAALEKRFNLDPCTLSLDEIYVLNIVGQEKIRKFEAKARQASDEGDPK